MDTMERILVVDDVSLICTMCSNALTAAGYEVITQPSGARCMAFLKNAGEEPVDLIILDVEMPYMNGFKTLEEIRKMDEYRKLPVMFLTSACTKETVNHAISLGAKDYLKKPFDTDELVSRVNKILRADLIAAARAKAEQKPETPAVPLTASDDDAEAEAVKGEIPEEAAVELGENT